VGQYNLDRKTMPGLRLRYISLQIVSVRFFSHRFVSHMKFGISLKANVAKKHPVFSLRGEKYFRFRFASFRFEAKRSAHPTCKENPLQSKEIYLKFSALPSLTVSRDQCEDKNLKIIISSITNSNLFICNNFLF
jgi:hypothetical protein